MRRPELFLNLFLPALIVLGVILGLLMASSGKFAPIAAFCLILGFILFAKAKYSRIKQGALLTFGTTGMTPSNKKFYFTGYAVMVLGIIFACI